MLFLADLALSWGDVRFEAVGRRYLWWPEASAR
jgi:hypothetical protein